MLKGAWILPATMLVVLILAAMPSVVFAADGDAFGPSMKTYFKDLPGVVPEEERVKAEMSESYHCTTGVGYTSEARRRFRGSILDDLPVQIYRCETPSGVTYTGTHMPNTQWVPGLNPRHLPE